MTHGQQSGALLLLQPLITNVDARGCSLGAIDRILGVLAAGERDAHPAVLERLRLGEDPQVDRVCRGAPSASASAMPSNGEVVALPVGEDHGRGGRADRARSTGSEGRGSRASAARTRSGIGEISVTMPVSCGRGLSSEKIAWSPRMKNSTPKMPWPPSASTTLRAWYRAELERLRRNRRRLPALAIVAELLPMTDRRAEQHAVLGRDRQQRDLAVELDEFLDDHARTVAAHVRDRIIPGRADLLRRLGGALALARARHHRLDHARQPDLLRPPRSPRRGSRRSDISR